MVFEIMDTVDPLSIRKPISKLKLSNSAFVYLHHCKELIHTSIKSTASETV